MLFRRIQIALLSALFIFILTSCHRYYFNIPEYKKVFHFEMVEIGGVDQAIMIKGDNKNNPVLVFLHGGPGYPLFPFEPMEDFMESLEEDFTIVYWEQRGTGKSYSSQISSKSMNVDQFIKDTKQVVEYTQQKTGVKKVFLWGHSWGSNIGALFASQYPEYLHAYISTGQSVNPFKNERMCYEFVYENAVKTNNKKALRQLSSIDTIADNYNLDDALLVRKWVNKFGGIVKRTYTEKPYVQLNEIRTILTASEYSVLDRFYLLLYPYYSAEKLWEEMKDINLIEQASRIEVPVYFLIGRYDIIVSHVLAERYFSILSAPAGKELIWFENSAHRPFIEEKEKFQDVVKNKILKEVLYNDDD